MSFHDTHPHPHLSPSPLTLTLTLTVTLLCKGDSSLDLSRSELENYSVSGLLVRFIVNHASYLKPLDKIVVTSKHLCIVVVAILTPTLTLTLVPM